MRPPIINIIDRAVRKAGRSLVRDFGEVQQLQVSVKGPGDFVTVADMKAEEILREELTRARPDLGFLGEESGLTEGSGAAAEGGTWIVDPLDGTTNFLHGLPQFCISVALREDGELTHGVVYEPLTDDLYWAARNNGAFLNDRRLRVSSRRNLNESLIATGIPHMGLPDHGRYLATLAAVMTQTTGVRRCGAAALDLANVAAGRYDGFWEYGLQQWDIAAGILLISESGGLVTDAGGGKDMLGSGDVVAGNDQLHAPLLTLLQRAAGSVQ